MAWLKFTGGPFFAVSDYVPTCFWMDLWFDGKWLTLNQGLGSLFTYSPINVFTSPMVLTLITNYESTNYVYRIERDLIDSCYKIFHKNPDISVILIENN